MNKCSLNCCCGVKGIKHGAGGGVGGVLLQETNQVDDSKPRSSHHLADYLSAARQREFDSLQSNLK